MDSAWFIMLPSSLIFNLLVISSLIVMILCSLDNLKSFWKVMGSVRHDFNKWSASNQTTFKLLVILIRSVLLVFWNFLLQFNAIHNRYHDFQGGSLYQKAPMLKHKLLALAAQTSHGIKASWEYLVAANELRIYNGALKLRAKQDAEKDLARDQALADQKRDLVRENQIRIHQLEDARRNDLVALENTITKLQEELSAAEKRDETQRLQLEAIDTKPQSHHPTTPRSTSHDSSQNQTLTSDQPSTTGLPSNIDQSSTTDQPTTSDQPPSYGHNSASGNSYTHYQMTPFQLQWQEGKAKSRREELEEISQANNRSDHCDSVIRTLKIRIKALEDSIADSARDVELHPTYQKLKADLGTLRVNYHGKDQLLKLFCSQLHKVLVDNGLGNETVTIEKLAEFMAQHLPDAVRIAVSAEQTKANAVDTALIVEKHNSENALRNQKGRMETEAKKAVLLFEAEITKLEQTIRDKESRENDLNNDVSAAAKIIEDLKKKVTKLEAKCKADTTSVPTTNPDTTFVSTANPDNATIKKLQDDLEAMTKERDKEHKALVAKSTDLIKEKKKNAEKALHESDKDAAAAIEELWPGQDLEVEGATLAFVAKVKTCVEYDRSKHRVKLANAKKATADVKAERDCRDCRDKQDLFNYYETLSRVYGQIADVVKTECDDKTLLRKAPWLNMQTGEFYPLESYTTMEQFHGEKVVEDLLTRFSAMKRHVKLMIHSSAFSDSSEVRDILGRTKNLVFELHNAVGRPLEADSDDEEEEEDPYWSDADYGRNEEEDEDEESDKGSDEESDDGMPVDNGGGWGNYDPDLDTRPIPQPPFYEYPPLP